MAIYIYIYIYTISIYTYIYIYIIWLNQGILYSLGKFGVVTYKLDCRGRPSLGTLHGSAEQGAGASRVPGYRGLASEFSQPAGAGFPEMRGPTCGEYQLYLWMNGPHKHS